MNNKGFTLVELLVVVAIMAVLSATFIPSLTAANGNTDEKVDEAAVAMLQTNIKLALQHSSMYKDAKDMVDDSKDDKLTIVYKVDENNNLLFDRCEIIDDDDGKVTSFDESDLGSELSSLRTKIIDFINGKMEPITLESDKYQDMGYYYTITFPDVDHKVDVEFGLAKFEVVTNSNLAAPGAYGVSRVGSTWEFPQSSRLHLHTGYNGLADSELGDVWKLTMTGENMSQFGVTCSYYRDGSGWGSGDNSAFSKITKTDTMFEFYFTAKEDWPKIGFIITNNGEDIAIVDNIQFTKVG